MSELENPRRVLRSFRDLEVYGLAREASRRVLLLTKKFPAEEKYALTDQICRSSRAVGAMIAEAWARRRYQAAFINKLNEAQGEAMESQSWLDQALDCHYLTPEQHQIHDLLFQNVGGKLQRMIDKADTFCV